MPSLFDENLILKGVRDRILGDPEGYKFLENLINAAQLCSQLLHVSSCESAVFHIKKELIVPKSDPVAERLILVIPESFAVEWEFSVSGYFSVKHKSLPSSLPQQVDAFNILYSGVAIPGNSQISFKNERIRLK